MLRSRGPAEVRGKFGDGRMVFENGLSLPLADGFSPGRPSDPGLRTCAHMRERRTEQGRFLRDDVTSARCGQADGQRMLANPRGDREVH